MKQVKNFKFDLVRLAIDAATTDLGYTVLEGDKVLKKGKFHAVGSSKWKRIDSIRNFINAVITKYEVKEIIIEDIQLQYTFIQGRKVPNLKSFKALAELRGAILSEAYKLGIKENKMHSYLASEWRSVLSIKTGRGATREISKQSAFEYVKKEYPELFDDSSIDEVESFCLGIAYVKNNHINL